MVEYTDRQKQSQEQERDQWYLLGITPPSPKSLERIQNRIGNTSCRMKLQWSPQYSIVPDDERPGRPLTLLAACRVISGLDSLLSDTCTNGRPAEKANKDHTNDDDFLEEELNDEIIMAKRLVEFFKKSANINEVELWTVTPFVPPFCPSGGYNDMLCLHSSEANDNSSWELRALQILQQYGVFHRPALLKKSQINELQSYVDESISNTEALISKHRPDIELGEDNFTFTEIASRNKQRFDLRMQAVEPATGKPTAAGQFVNDNVLGNPKVRGLLLNYLSCSSGNNNDGEINSIEDEIDFDLSVIYSRPGACTQRWHADGAHISDTKTAFEENVGATTANYKYSPYAICLFLPLMDLNEKVGYTQFWPGSHCHPDMVRYSDQLVSLTKTAYDGTGRAGDSIWYDYRTVHRGMPNTSKNTMRPVVQIIFKKKWYVEETNYGAGSIVDSKPPPQDKDVSNEEEAESDGDDTAPENCSYCLLVDIYPSMVAKGECTCIKNNRD